MTTLNPAQTTAKPASPGYAGTLIITALIAGTLDILAAIFILAKGNATPVLRYIASSLVGKAAAKTGTDMVVLGLCIHYLIAAGWVTVYFIAYKYVPLLRKNIVLSSFLYGIFVYAAMQYVFVPMTRIHLGPFNWQGALTNAVILMFTIGLPAALMRKRYEARKQGL
jgi:hypothetical protein